MCFFSFRKESRLFRLSTTSLLLLFDYIVPIFIMVWCSGHRCLCLTQIEKNGVRKLSTRDKDLNKRTLVVSFLSISVYIIQSVPYGYEMFSAVFMQVNNKD